MVFSNFFENLKNEAYQVFDLWPQKGQKFSLKKEAFGTLDFMLIAALNEFKILSGLP